MRGRKCRWLWWNGFFEWRLNRSHRTRANQGAVGRRRRKNLGSRPATLLRWELGGTGWWHAKAWFLECVFGWFTWRLGWGSEVETEGLQQGGWWGDSWSPGHTDTMLVCTLAGHACTPRSVRLPAKRPPFPLSHYLTPIKHDWITQESFHQLVYLFFPFFCGRRENLVLTHMLSPSLIWCFPFLVSTLISLLLLFLFFYGVVLQSWRLYVLAGMSIVKRPCSALVGQVCVDVWAHSSWLTLAWNGGGGLTGRGPLRTHRLDSSASCLCYTPHWWLPFIVSSPAGVQ